MYPFLLLVTLGIIWGLFFSLARFAGESGVSQTSLITAITAIDVLAFLAICKFRNVFPLVRFQSLAFYAVCGVLGYLLPMQLELYAAPRIGAGLLTMIVSLTPILTILIALLVRTEPVCHRKIAGVILAMLAMAPIFAADALIDITAGGRHFLAMIMALMVALSYAIYHNYITKFWPESEDGWQLATGEAIACSLIMIPIFLLVGDADISPLLHPKVSGIIAGYVILSVSSIYLYFYLIQHGGAVFVSMAGFVSIGAGVIFGMLFFGETYPAWIVLSLATLIGATWLATETKKESQA